jgi:hypothetical protein
VRGLLGCWLLLSWNCFSCRSGSSDGGVSWAGDWGGGWFGLVCCVEGVSGLSVVVLNDVLSDLS